MVKPLVLDIHAYADLHAHASVGMAPNAWHRMLFMLSFGLVLTRLNVFVRRVRLQ